MIKNIVFPVRKIIQLLFGGMLCSFALTGCADSNKAPPDLNMVVSVSSDGHYAIATNTNKQAVLWNLKDHSYKIIFKDANIYSAHFIKNTNDFIYQNDKTNEVVVENTDGKVIKTFNPGFPTYGEALTSNLNIYAAANEELSVYKINLSNNQKYVLNQSWCIQDHKGAKYQGKGTSDCANFMSSNQTFGLQFTPDETKLIGANFFDLFIWDLKTNTGKVIQKNDAQTVAAISPAGTYVLTADATSHGYFYNLNTQDGFKFGWNTPLSPITDTYFKSLDQNFINEVLSIKFIDQKHAVAIFSGVPDLFNFAVLFNTDPGVMKYDAHWAQKVTNAVQYFPLIPNAATDTTYKKDWPLTTDQFSRDKAIDTAPAHIF